MRHDDFAARGYRNASSLYDKNQLRKHSGVSRPADVSHDITWNQKDAQGALKMYLQQRHLALKHMSALAAAGFSG